VIQATALNIETLQRQLDTQVFGTGERLTYVPIVDSTNALAMKLALHETSEEGVVVLTDSQTAGKGRLGRKWVDAFGYNVLSSTLLKPLFPPYLLVMIASLAIVDTIDEVCKIVAAIKWPNDVLIENRKVAGILIETSHDRTGRTIAIMGIGVNIYTYPTLTAEEQAIAHKAITLEMACGHRVSRETFIARLLKHIETSYTALQQEAVDPIISAYRKGLGPTSRLIRERWRDRLATLGRSIEVRQGDTVISGIAEEVDDNGELLLRRHSGERVSITWGDIGYPTE